jgi:hypothetical protein
MSKLFIANLKISDAGHAYKVDLLLQPVEIHYSSNNTFVHL